jgi:hypothetical protein
MDSQGRPVATLILVMTLLFTASFGAALAVPALPLDVHAALASVPLMKGNHNETRGCDDRIPLLERLGIGANKANAGA